MGMLVSGAGPQTSLAAARSYLGQWLVATGRWNQVLECLAVGAGKAGAEPFFRAGAGSCMYGCLALGGLGTGSDLLLAL